VREERRRPHHTFMKDGVVDESWLVLVELGEGEFLHGVRGTPVLGQLDHATTPNGGCCPMRMSSLGRTSDPRLRDGKGGPAASSIHHPAIMRCRHGGSR